MTDTPKQQPQTADAEIADLMASLDADFGKKKKDHKAANRQFHQQNPSISKSAGKAPERLNPEDSAAWKPVARVTHVVRQFCRTCNDQVEFIGGEFVKYQSVREPTAHVQRRVENAPNVWWFDDEVEDIVEQHVQEVARCVGCIKVEQQAIEIVTAADRSMMQPELMPTQVWRAQESFDEVIESEVALQRRREVHRQRSKQLALKVADNTLHAETQWPESFSRPATDTLDIDLGD